MTDQLNEVYKGLLHLFYNFYKISCGFIYFLCCQWVTLNFINVINIWSICVSDYFVNFFPALWYMPNGMKEGVCESLQINH